MEISTYSTRTPVRQEIASWSLLGSPAKVTNICVDIAPLSDFVNYFYNIFSFLSEVNAAENFL